MRTPNEHKKYVAPGFRKGFSFDAEGTEHSKDFSSNMERRRLHSPEPKTHSTTGTWFLTAPSTPRCRAPRERFEAFSHSVRDVLAQRWVKTKTTYEQQECQTHLLPFHGVSHRDVRWPTTLATFCLILLVQEADREKEYRLARVDRAGTGCGTGKRRLGPSCGMFPRLDGHDATPRDGLWSALRVRHVSSNRFVNGWQQENPDNWLRDGDPWEIAPPSRESGNQAERHVQTAGWTSFR